MPVIRRKNTVREATPKLLKIFVETSPQKFLALRLNASPNKLMLETIERLQKDFGFDNGIINVILDYSLRKNKQ